VVDTAARLLRLLSLLTSRGDWRGAELAARLGVTARTVRRDVERLRELGYRVHAEPGPAGGYALRPGSGLPPLLLDDDAAVAVAVGLSAAAAAGVVGTEEAAIRAGAALEQVMPARLRRRVEAVRATTVPLAAGGPAVDPSVLAQLAVAGRNGERLRFRYRDRTGAQSRRHVEPHRLVSTGRRWYLVARDLDRQEWRSFRVDRINDPAPTGVRSRPADPPDAARFVSEGVSLGPYRWRAKVLLRAPVAMVTELVPATVGVVEDVDGEQCLFVSGADSLDAMALHLALLGVPFTVLEPPELRERCAVLAERLHNAARADPGSAGPVGEVPGGPPLAPAAGEAGIAG